MNQPQDTDLLSRRQFISTGVRAGFALAVLPTTAWAIATSADGIEAGPVSIPLEGGTMPGYRAMPKGKGPFPAVIVIHEIFGVHEYIQDVCRRLAKEGYCAVAPDLYFRQGDVTKIKDVPEIVAQVVSKVPQKQVWADLDRTMSWLKGAHADPSRVAITGFCWGGSFVWTYCAKNPAIRAGAAWYGRLAASPTQPPGAETPQDIIATLRTPVLGLYGGKDAGIPLADIEKMREAMRKHAANRSEIIVYPEAEHGFHADYRPSYHEASARDAWGKMLAWFRKNGVG